jgi:hypothetical protein
MILEGISVEHPEEHGEVPGLVGAIRRAAA